MENSGADFQVHHAGGHDDTQKIDCYYDSFKTQGLTEQPKTFKSNLTASFKEKRGIFFLL